MVSRSGEKLIDRSQELMIEQVRRRLSSSAELFAVAGRAGFIEESLQIMVESVRDRIVGYPTMDGWEQGNYVPFEVETEIEIEGGQKKKKRRRMYPLNQPPVPLDWQVTRDHHLDVDDSGDGSGDDPFIDSRWKEYPTAFSSTKTASYRIPGRSMSMNNNNTTTTSALLLKNDGIYQSTGDLSVLIKALYEGIEEILTIQINFFNGGAGTTLQFPATAAAAMDDDDSSILPLSSDSYYVTEGCEWMTELRNPYTGKPYATTKATHQHCPPKGTTVPSRLRNPMENLEVRKVLEYTALQFANTANTNSSSINSNSNSNSTNNSNSSSTSVPPNNSQKLRRAQVHGRLVFWNGPMYSMTDKKTLVLRASKAIFDRM